MGEGERAADLHAELERPPHGQGALALHDLLEVLALDVLEDDVLALAVLAAVDHGDDARVRELRDRAGLAAEALDRVRVAPVDVVQDLQRHLALEQAVVRPVDARHAARADELLELVAAGHEFPDHRAGGYRRKARKEDGPRFPGGRPTSGFRADD